jgi:hypothetical protein
LYWTDLRGAAFVVTAGDPGPDITAMIIARLSGPGHRPSITVQDVSRENLLTFATAGRVTVTAGAGHRSLGDANLPTLREIHDAFGSTKLDQGVHWLADNDNPALRRFLEMLAQRYARPLPQS